MAFTFLSVLLIFSAFLRATSENVNCEATPVEYDNSISLFCQENDNDNKDAKSTGPVPDLTSSLTKVIVKDEDDEENSEMYGYGEQAENPTFMTVDPKNVTDLSLWAQFDEIPANAFSKFPNARILYLAQFYNDNSRLVKISDDAFRGLANLEWLGLHVNLSQKSIPNAITKLSNLISLVLSESNLNSEFTLGNYWPKLRYLTISDSPNTTLADDAFDSGSKTLNEIEFTNIGIESFPKSIMNLRNLTRIDIDSTSLSEVPPDAFYKSASSIVSIRLNRNRISILHPDSFHGLTKLTVLQLAYNEIDVIPASIFDDLTSLESLNLCNNKISSMPASIFDHNKNLHILDLGDNPINATESDFLKDHEGDESEYGGDGTEDDGEDDEDEDEETGGHGSSTTSGEKEGHTGNSTSSETESGEESEEMGGSSEENPEGSGNSTEISQESGSSTETSEESVSKENASGASNETESSENSSGKSSEMESGESAGNSTENMSHETDTSGESGTGEVSGNTTMTDSGNQTAAPDHAATDGKVPNASKITSEKSSASKSGVKLIFSVISISICLIFQ